MTQIVCFGHLHAHKAYNICLCVFLSARKRKDKHKENEAIQFDFDMENDVADNVAQEMVNSQPICRFHEFLNPFLPETYYGIIQIIYRTSPFVL